jgi:hypothetical protein
MSKSSNKLKIECLMQYLPTLTRPTKRKPEEDKVSTSYRVNVRGQKRR